MTRTILRLTSLVNRQSRWRTGGMVLGVAIGVGLLLTLLGAAQGLTDREQRSSWLNAAHIPMYEASGQPFTVDTVLLLRITDYVDREAIDRMDIAFLPGNADLTPWQTALPEPGTYYASPALIELIGNRPPEQLGDRFGTLIGEIPASALASPDSLVALTGKDVATLERFGYAQARPDLVGEPDGAHPVYRMIMIIGGIAMFLPVLLLISTTTQLGAAERAERLTALRLIGASPQSLVRATALEMMAIALAGSLLGLAGWRLLRPIGARFSIDDGRFYPSDLAVSPGAITLVIVATIVATAIAAALRIARMGIGPLGVARERAEAAPSFLRLLPLLAGIGMFASVTVIFDDRTIDGSLVQLAVIGGFLLSSLGLIWAGPWLTSSVSRIANRLARSAAGVVAAGRIQRHPNATYRSVSGLVLAVFMVSVFAGSASSVLESDDPRDGAQVFPLTLVYTPPVDGLTPDELAPTLADLQQIPGVTRAMLAYAVRDDPGIWFLAREDAPFANVRNRDDRAWVRFDGYEYFWGDPETSRPIFPGLDLLPAVDPEYILVANDGRDGVIDEIRTSLEQSGVSSYLARTRPDDRDMTTRKFVNSLATLAYLGIAITILIAGISLTVATAASMLERKRVFGLMRLMGMPNRIMNRIVTFEAVAPLIAVLALSIGIGFLIAWMMVEGLSTDRSLGSPDLRFYLAILSSLALAIVSVLAVTGVIRRNTEIHQTRFE
jgi:hypothetical protein